MPYFHESELDIPNKPYNKCVICKYLGVCCDGPNFLAMTAERRVEWIDLRRRYLGWSNEFLAEKAGISTATLYRNLHSDKGAYVDTLARLVKALVNGSWGQYPCAIDAIQAEDGTWVAKCQAVQTQLEESQRKVDHLLKQTEFDKDQLTEKDKLLTERRDFLHRKDIAIWILSALLGISVIAIIIGIVAIL